MKNLSLLMIACAVTMSVASQQRSPITIYGPQKLNFEKVPYAVGNASLTDSRYLSAKTAGEAKATSSPGRWYNYSTYLKLKTDYDRIVAGTGIYYMDYFSPVMWNDTTNMVTSLNGSTYTTAHTKLVSLGTVLRPQFAGFNRTDLFGTGILKLGGSPDAYIVDSISISYFYVQGSKATAGHKDTVRLAFHIGDGSSTSSIFVATTLPAGHYSAGTKFLDVSYDSVLNVAVGKSTGVPTQYMDILLDHNTDTSVFSKHKSYLITDIASGLAAPLAIPSLNAVSCVISFKSGDPAAALQTLPGDTLTGVGGRYYDLFQPFVDYITIDNPLVVAKTSPSWFDYDSTDYNVGLFKQLPNTDLAGWHNLYTPNWGWNSSTTLSGASYYGYPDIGYHVVCPTCKYLTAEVKTPVILSSVTAIPNPANNEVNINFSLVEAANVSVSLTNIIGQVVATQNISNKASGVATFNTTALPSGVYVYTLKANGEIATGRVVVAH